MGEAPTTDRLRLLLCGLAAGDAIGSLTEFVLQEDVPRAYAAHRDEGWPFAPVRGPVWDRGEPTDDTDMAMCIVRPFLERGRFDPEAVAAEFVQWLDSGPKDIGGTTVRSLSRLRSGTPWHEAGLREHRARPRNAANGSLMRNGVVPAMAGTLDEALTYTAWHAMMTHYDPLSMMCCGAQTWLIRRLLDGEWPLTAGWHAAFEKAWESWLAACADPHVRGWRGNVAERLAETWQTFRSAAWPPAPFDPFAVDFVGQTGYCVLTLQIAVWALEWSKRDDPFPTPDGFPPEVFEHRAAECIGWPAMIGYDADTYGAAAGPLIAAAHGAVPDSMTEDLWAVHEFDRLAVG